MNRTGTTQKRIEQVDGRTVLFLTVCSCLVSFLTTDLIGHAVFTFWLLLILCYFGLYKQGIGCYTVYLVTVVGLYLETKYSISSISALLSMIYKPVLPAMASISAFPYSLRQAHGQSAETAYPSQGYAGPGRHATLCSDDHPGVRRSSGGYENPRLSSVGTYGPAAPIEYAGICNRAYGIPLSKNCG